MLIGVHKLQNYTAVLFLNSVCIFVDVHWNGENFHREIFVVTYDKLRGIIFMSGSLMVICFVGFSIEEEITVIGFAKLRSRW